VDGVSIASPFTSQLFAVNIDDMPVGFVGDAGGVASIGDGVSQKKKECEQGVLFHK
jgi:hypothetical protein